MKILRLLWQGVKSVLGFLSMLLCWEPVITLIAGAIWGGILYGGGLLIYLAFDYCLNALSHATGWKNDDIKGVIAGLWTSAIIIALIVGAHSLVDARWRESHSGIKPSFGKRFLIRIRFWGMTLLAAVVLVSGIIALGVK